ncbi:hypothetical protein THAOC_00817 [Thalassiosira oceanica]|uniref:Uncharacterized protein n=1 Tax=Thalassiosira oceanica TaxID=159749 RepID=K0TNP8_THAOC|nr:hypothetical protein THAOC_00817 [Thalassiosira oceanica]|eukprot:EJK77356.1 hypothetical protein THAOC_00817 [Thalassiosira oceanica]
MAMGKGTPRSYRQWQQSPTMTTTVPNEIYITSPNDCGSTANADFEDSCLSCDYRPDDDSGAGADGGDNDGRGREEFAPLPPGLETLLLVAGLTSEPSRETPATLRRRQGTKDERTKNGPETFKTPTATDTPRPRSGAETSELAPMRRRTRWAPEQQPKPPTASASGRQRMSPTFAGFAGHTPLPFAVTRKANGSLNFIL